MMVEAARPYDDQWGDADDAFAKFHIAEAELKAAVAANWVKCIQPSWKDDDHRAQPLYCFEDIHRYYEQVCHRITPHYIKKFWTARAIAEATAKLKKGPMA